MEAHGSLQAVFPGERDIGSGVPEQPARQTIQTITANTRITCLDRDRAERDACDEEKEGRKITGPAPDAVAPSATRRSLISRRRLVINRRRAGRLQDRQADRHHTHGVHCRVGAPASSVTEVTHKKRGPGEPGPLFRACNED